MTDKEHIEVDFTSEKTDLFLENNMDEMLRYKNYELGYKIFTRYFSVVYSMSVLAAAVGGVIRDIPLAAVGIFLTAFTAVVRMIYAAKAASQGIMNPTFAERIVKGFGKSYLVLQVCYVLMMTAGIMSAIESSRPYIPFFIVGLIAAVTSISEYFFAKKNMKVLEKMLSEDSEE